jgi:hypothetical protein
VTRGAANAPCGRCLRRLPILKSWTAVQWRAAARVRSFATPISPSASGSSVASGSGSVVQCR